MSHPLSPMELASRTLGFCQKCGAQCVDLTETGINVDQFRREDSRCFLFYSKTKPLVECRTGGPWHGPR